MEIAKESVKKWIIYTQIIIEHIHTIHLLHKPLSLSGVQKTSVIIQYGCKQEQK